jgi:hypothetical protein
MTDTTTTIETLTVEVRVLTIGVHQVTLSMAEQLDRLDLFFNGPEDIKPFGRVRTGAKITGPASVDSIRPIGLECATNKEGFTAEPIVEVIGCSDRDEDRGALVIFQVAIGDIELCVPKHEEKARELRAAVSRWLELPLIVLAGGLR